MYRKKCFSSKLSILPTTTCFIDLRNWLTAAWSQIYGSFTWSSICNSRQPLNVCLIPPHTEHGWLLSKLQWFWKSVAIPWISVSKFQIKFRLALAMSIPCIAYIYIDIGLVKSIFDSNAFSSVLKVLSPAISLQRERMLVWCGLKLC